MKDIKTKAALILKRQKKVQSAVRNNGKTLAENAELQLKLEEAVKNSCIDPLTGLSNRRDYDQRIASHLSTASRQKDSTLVLMTFDLDKFKNINDNYGHDTGDIVLKRTAELLQHQVFTRHGDIVARFGGEEITVAFLCPKEESQETSLKLAEKARVTLETFNKIWPDGSVGAENTSSRPPDRSATASIGIAFIDVDKKTSVDDSEATRTNSDRAMYQAKENGRNRVYFMDASGDIHPSPLNPPESQEAQNQTGQTMYKAREAMSFFHKRCSRRSINQHKP